MRVTKAPEERREELIRAARELFDQYGIKETRVSQIVEKVGVAQGLFYYYFKSKEEIVDEVIHIVITEISEDVQKILADTSKTFYQKLSDFIALYLQVIDQFSGDAETNLKNMLESISKNPIARQSNHLLQQHLETLIQQGVAQGVITIAYPEEMTQILLYGLMELSKKKLISQKQLLTIVEQGLHLPPDSLRIEPIL